MSTENRMSVIEMLMWAVVLGGGMFIVDAYLSSNQEIKEVKDIPTISYTDEEKRILCETWNDCFDLSKALVYEARGEGRIGMKAVAFVVMNRVNHSNWPHQIHDVLHQERQFDYVKDWMKQRTPTEKDWTTAMAVSYDVLHNNVSDPTEGSTHYTEKNINRGWMKNLEYVTTINNHKFFRGDN